jgi:hypothetical protein
MVKLLQCRIIKRGFCRLRQTPTLALAAQASKTGSLRESSPHALPLPTKNIPSLSTAKHRSNHNIHPDIVEDSTETQQLQSRKRSAPLATDSTRSRCVRDSTKSSSKPPSPDATRAPPHFDGEGSGKLLWTAEEDLVLRTERNKGRSIPKISELLIGRYGNKQDVLFLIIFFFSWQ